MFRDPYAWVAATVIAGAGALALVPGCEPEVIHSHDDLPLYRLTGDDAEQEAVEFCFDMNDRQAHYAGVKGDQVTFCCAPRSSDWCDMPDGHEERAEELRRRAEESRRLSQPQRGM